MAGLPALAVEFAEATGADLVAPTPPELFISDWMALGPFPIEPATDENRLPESWSQDILSPGSVTSLSGELRGKTWRQLDTDEEGKVELDPVFSPNTNSAVYAGAYIFSENACTQDLLVGSDDGITVWMNGTRVFDKQSCRACVADSDSFPVRLNRGRNLLLVRVNQAARGWAFCARFADNTGLSASLSADAASAAKLPDMAMLCARPKLVSGPYVQNVTTDSAVLAWYTDVPSLARVEVSDGNGSWQFSTAQNRRVGEVHIGGLKPDSEYAYAVTIRNLHEANIRRVGDDSHRFRTFPLKARAIPFLVYGDSRSEPERHSQVISAMAKENADFVVHTGDLVGAGSQLRLWPKEFFAPADPLMRRVPMYAVLGNHEENSPHYFALLSLPGGERWYSFDVLGTHLVSLDSCSDVSEGSAQYAWLIDDLEQNRQARWTFVFMHHPTYSSGGHAAVGSDGLPKETGVRTAQRIMPPLAAEYGITAVFAGHDHFYERSMRDGVYYIVTGGGGAPGHGEGNPAQNPYRQKHHSGLHYCMVTLDGDRGRVVVKTPQGKTVDSFELAARADDGR
jgi:predicted phosphodiesterase